MVPFNPVNLLKSLISTHFKSTKHRINNVGKALSSCSQTAFQYVNSCRFFNSKIRQNGMNRIDNLPPWGFLSGTAGVFVKGQFNLSALPVISSGFYLNPAAKADISNKTAFLLYKYNKRDETEEVVETVEKTVLLGDQSIKKLVDSCSDPDIDINFQLLSMNIQAK